MKVGSKRGRSKGGSNKRWLNKLWVIGTIAGAITAGVAAFSSHVVSISDALHNLFSSKTPTVSILMGDQVHFRPLAKPPEDPSKTGAPSEWANSHLTITARVSYSHTNPEAPAVHIVSEELLLEMGTIRARYFWAYFVNFKNEGPCGEDWLCILDTVQNENVEPGKASKSHETMLLPTDTPALTWKSFIDQIIAAGGPDSIRVTLKSHVAAATNDGNPDVMLTRSCEIDVTPYRRELNEWFSPGQDPRPVFWAPVCR